MRLLLSLILVGMFGCRSQAPVDIRDDGLTATVLVDDRPFTVYHNEGARPYFYPVMTADGREVTRGYPMNPHPDESSDHPHHVSLWFAHGDVNGLDFWHGEGNRIQLVSMDQHQDSLLIANEWVDDQDQVVCTEHRQVDFGGDDGSRTIDLDIELVSRESPLRLGDTKEGTMAIRLAPPLRLDGNLAHGSYLSSDGLKDGQVWGTRARWVASSGMLEGSPVTIAMFDHPGNPNHPTWWHARSYGLFAANPFGRQDFEGQESPSGAMLALDGVPIRFRYRVLILDEEVDVADLERRWDQWMKTEEDE